MREPIATKARECASWTSLQDPEDTVLLRAGTFAAEGPIPGVGRVAIGVGRVATDPGGLTDRSTGFAFASSDVDLIFAPEPFAPLAEGGFVTHYSLYGPGMHLEGAPRYGFVHPSPDFRPRTGTVDLAGLGLWVYTGDANGTFLTLLSRDSRRFPVAQEGRQLIAVPGGGVVHYVPDGPRGIALTRFGPDGPIEGWSIEDPSFDPAVGVRAALAGGTICGNSAGGVGLHCVDPAGVERSLAVEDVRLQTLVAGLPRFVPLPSGKIAILQELWEQALQDGPLAGRDDPTFVFDPIAMTVVEVEARPVFQVSTGPDGRAWGAAWDVERNGFPMEITDTGFAEVELPFAESSDDPLLTNLLRREVGFVLEDTDVLLIWPRSSYGGLQALSGKVLRVPHPE